MGYIYSSMFKKENDKVALVNGNKIYLVGTAMRYIGKLEDNKLCLSEAEDANAFIRDGMLYRIGENTPIANAAEGEVRTGVCAFGTPVLWYDKDVDDNVALAFAAIRVFSFELNVTFAPSAYGYEDDMQDEEKMCVAEDDNQRFLTGVLKAVLLGIVLFASGLSWIKYRNIIFKSTPIYAVWGTVVFLISFAIIMCKNYFAHKEKLVECIVIPYLVSAGIAAIVSNVIWSISLLSEGSGFDFSKLIIIPVVYSVFFALPGVIEAIAIGVTIICFISAKNYLEGLKKIRGRAKKGKGLKMKKSARNVVNMDKTFLSFQMNDCIRARKKVTKFEVLLYIISIGLAFEITVACSMFAEQIFNVRYTSMQSIYFYGCTFISSYVALAFNKKGIFNKILLYSCGFVFGFLISEIWIDISVFVKAFLGGYKIKAFAGGYKIKVFSDLINMDMDKMIVLYASTFVAFALGIGANMYIKHERKQVRHVKF